MKTALAVLFLAGLASPAAATEWIHCSDADGEVEIGLLVAHHEVLSPIGATLRGPALRQWTSDPAYGDGPAITVGQAFGNDEMMLVDLLDGDFNLSVASLRIFKAEEGTDFVQGGTLVIDGVGAWAVACEGP